MEPFEKVHVLEAALPQWPVWAFCALAIVLTSISAVPVGYARIVFGMMSGYQIAQMVTRHKAYKIRKTLS